VRIWDVSSGRCVRLIKAFGGDSISAVQFHPTKACAVLVAVGKKIHEFDLSGDNRVVITTASAISAEHNSDEITQVCWPLPFWIDPLPSIRAWHRVICGVWLIYVCVCSHQQLAVSGDGSLLAASDDSGEVKLMRLSPAASAAATASDPFPVLYTMRQHKNV
jgi:hypothetical protein